MSDPIATVTLTSAVNHAHDASPLFALPVDSVVRPMAADVPPQVELSEILEDVADDSVSAPDKLVGDLVDVVHRAKEHDVDLRIVVLDKDPGRDSQLRDLATEVGAEDGGTVLVLSPSWVGTFSDSISRVQLEGGQDRTYTDSSVKAANNFLDELVEPGPPWALMTLVVIFVVVVAGALTLLAKIRRARTSSAVSKTTDTGATTSGNSSSSVRDVDG